MALPSVPAVSQISLSSAITLALNSDARLKLAQDDLRKAIAVQQEVRDAYVPSAAANGGAGYTYGITLTVPTVFTLDTQSLIYSPSQRHYAAAARWELQAAQLALTMARERVEEDVISSYLSLDAAQRATEVLAAVYQHANALVAVVEMRRNAGIESQLEWKQACRTAAQIRLQILQHQSEEENLQARVAQMTGLPQNHLSTLPESIPELPTPSTETPERKNLPDSDDLVHAGEQAQARRERVLADARGPWRPVITFNGQYARVSPINNVTEYYDLHGRYNIFSFGAIIRFPVLDAAARARQREAHADAARAMDELAAVQVRQEDDRRNLEHTLAEFGERVEVARLDAEIASDQLALTTRLSHGGGDGAAIMSPKDVERAAIQERQRYAEQMDAALQLHRLQISYLRQTGALDAWVQSMRTQPQNAPITQPLLSPVRGWNPKSTTP